MARWIQIQPQNVLGLSLKIRVRAGHVSSDSMWLQPRFVPHAHHRHMTHAHSAGHSSGRPMRGGSSGGRFGSCQNRRLFPGVSRLGRPARGASSKPSMPFCCQFLFQARARRGLIPVWFRILRKETPSASSNNTRARRTIPAGKLVDRSTCCKSERSSQDSRKGSSAVNMLPYIMGQFQCATYLCNETLGRVHTIVKPR